MALDLIKKGDFYIEPIDDLQNGKLSPEKVREILFKNKIVFGDKIRPVFTGVYFDERGRAVATDTHIIIVYKFSKNDERYDDLKGKIIDKEGNEIEGNYSDYDNVFRYKHKTNYCFKIKIDKKLISFLYKLDKQTKSKYKSGFYVKYGDFQYGYGTKRLYNLIKALYDLGETELLVYTFDSGYTILLGKNTKSMIAPMVSTHYEFPEKECAFCEMSDYDALTFYCTTNFEQFLADYREGKINLDEVKKPITGNFATMLKMFEENGIQTEFVDTNEKIIERLKKEGHSDENINFSLQEDFELDDEDDEPKQGTLNFDFWDYQNAKRIANEMYQPIIGEYRGKVEAYNDVITRIGKFKDLGVSGDKIVDEILSQAKHWARFYSELMEENKERIPESAKSIYKELTKKDEGNDKE